jgi:TolB-like protein/cytochrome c-type biogenesis protein CcmH/NrfG
MAELDDKQRTEDFQAKLETIRQTTMAEELVRLEAFAASHVTELAAARRSEEESRFRELMEQAAQRRTAGEAALQSVEPQVLGALESAIKSRAESRRRDEEALRKKAEEERIRQETARKKAEEEARLKAEADQRKREDEQRKLELQRKKTEEEARLRAEADQRKRKEEERQRAEIEKKKKDEEHRRHMEVEQKRRQEEERHRLEEEARKKMEEDLRRQQEEQRRAEEEERMKREEEERTKARLAEEARQNELKERDRRVQTHLASAKTSHQAQNYAEAAAETAKALALDPGSAEALALDAKIRQDQAAPRTDALEEMPSKAAKSSKKSADRSKKSRVPVLLFIVIVAGALLVGGILFFQLRKSVFPASTSLAVLPWSAGQTGVEENQIGSSLAEEVARQFERSPQAAVLGFTTAFGLSHTKADPVQSAFALGYSYVLHGSISRSGDSYTAALKLLDSTGTAVWEKSFTKSPDALPQLPSEVVAELRDVMKIPAPSGGGAPKSAAGGAAYLLFLRGSALLHSRAAADIAAAYPLLDQAAAQDPEFSDVLAAKALAITLAYQMGSPLPGATLDDAKKLSADAIANNPGGAEGYLVRGMVFDELKQYRMALQQFDNALQRAPSSSEAFLYKAVVHLKVGQHEEGMNALTAAYRLSPRDPAVLTLIAQTYQLARATQEGFPYHEKAIEYVADSTAYLAGPVADAILTDAALTLAQADRVGAALQRMIAARPDDYRMIYRLARLYQVSGKGLEAVGLLSTAEGLIKAQLQAQPADAEAAAFLTLILTRQGKFTDAVPLAQSILAANAGNAKIAYLVAQMYSLQMYSGKTMSVDEEVKKLCTATIHDALAADYRFDELANGDFYNMYEHSDFKSVIQVPLK